MFQAALAKELGLCYAAIALATDYDCWRESDEPVSVEMVLKTFKENAAKAVSILLTAIPKLAVSDWKGVSEKAKVSPSAAFTYPWLPGGSPFWWGNLPSPRLVTFVCLPLRPYLLFLLSFPVHLPPSSLPRPSPSLSLPLPLSPFLYLSLLSSISLPSFISLSLSPSLPIHLPLPLSPPSRSGDH